MAIDVTRSGIVSDVIDVIDLRSDTVTLPPPGMRAAMAAAEVGDDVYGEDPTINRLEAMVAERLDTDAALFCASGTMANLLALIAHCPRGRTAIVGDQSDIWRWEAHGASVLGGIGYRPVTTRSNGELAIADLEATIDPADDAQCAIAGVIALENTHGMCGGRVLSFDYLAQAQAWAQRHRLPLHLDGARLFNAAIASGVEPRAIARVADTVAVCLSKGLAAPVGSVLAGPGDVIARARRWRKMLGGGWRQAGVLAAAGIYALEHMVERLREDHATARQLADALHHVPGIALESPVPETNIVFFRLADPALRVDAFLAALRADGVRVLELGPGRLRAVTHYGITHEGIERAAAAIARAVDRTRAAASDIESATETLTREGVPS